jgi:hypothetical protein
VKPVLHIDDMYSHNPEDFPTLRSFLAEKGFQLYGIARFEDAQRTYNSKKFPEIVIMDILYTDGLGGEVQRGVDIAKAMEESNQASSQSPCIIYYTGARKDDPSIELILRHDAYTPIVFKSMDPSKDARDIYDHFPESLRIAKSN